MLLGRPWLHKVGAVPSTLHQRVKYICGNQVISIHAEKELIIPSNVAATEPDIPVIDIQHSEEDIPFHSFEFETVNSIANPEPIRVDHVFSPAERLSLKYRMKNHFKSRKVPLIYNQRKWGLGYRATFMDKRRKKFRCSPIQFIKPGEPYKDPGRNQPTALHKGLPMSLVWATWPPIRWDQILEPSKPPEEEEKDEDEEGSQMQQLQDQVTLTPAPNQGHNLPTSLNQGHNLPTSISKGHDLPISAPISKGHDLPISAKSTPSVISQGQKQPIH